MTTMADLSIAAALFYYLAKSRKTYYNGFVLVNYILELSHYMKQDKFSYNLAHAIYDSNGVFCSVGGSESLVRMCF